jgi:hypothetical protein
MKAAGTNPPDLRRHIKDVLKTILGSALTGYLSEAMGDIRTSRSPDRRILRKTILPSFAVAGGDILWIGCKRYTKDYYQLLETAGGRCWTVDIDVTAACWGNGERHHIGDICRVEEWWRGASFDSVLCNGVLGFGVNTPEAQRLCLASMAKIMKPKGVLLVGWNTDRIEDPVAAGLLEPWFERTGLRGMEDRRVCAGTTHVYDVFHRRPSLERSAS